jgi:phosphatidylinositol glycan class C protein
MLNTGLAAAGALMYCALAEPSQSRRVGLAKARVAALFVLCLQVAAPVLHTLTSSFSEDTIYALAMALCCVHLLFHDYSPRGYLSLTNSAGSSSSHNSSSSSGNSNNNTNSDGDSSGAEAEAGLSLRGASVSLNAALFTALLLASRLAPPAATSLLHLAALCFALLPAAARALQRRSLILHGLAVLLQAAGTGRLLLGAAPNSDWLLLAVYAMGVLLLGGAAPLLFLRMQCAKRAFRGPWEICRDL